jgi:hypothetical protein
MGANESFDAGSERKLINFKARQFDCTIASHGLDIDKCKK